MSEEERQTAAVQSCDYDYAPAPQMRLVACNDSAPAEEEDLDFPIPYDDDLAQQWAREDPDFHIETYRQDPCFTKDAQARLRHAMARVEAGEYVTQTYVNGEWVFADA